MHGPTCNFWADLTPFSLQRALHPAPPFGLGWAWFGRQLLRMLRAEAH